MVYFVIAPIIGIQCFANESGQCLVCFSTIPITKIILVANVVAYVSSKFTRGISKAAALLHNSKEFAVFDPGIVKFSFDQIVALAVPIECVDVFDYLLNVAD